MVIDVKVCPKYNVYEGIGDIILFKNVYDRWTYKQVVF